MTTIFAAPKAFKGLTGVIQHNAIASWKSLRPEFQVILFGDEAGIAEAAKEHGVEHVPEVPRNEFGTPLINSLFKRAEQLARFPLLAYVNSDIILLSDFAAAVHSLKPMTRFLMVGQQWNVDISERIDFSLPDTEEQLRARTMKGGWLGLLWAMDYFVFPSGTWRELPEFAIGRPGWDNWMLFRARNLNIPLINASLSVTAVHQNHPPGHSSSGIEAQQNMNIFKETGMQRGFSMLDATHLLTKSGLREVSLRSPEEMVSDAAVMKGYRKQIEISCDGANLADDDRLLYRHILASSYSFQAAQAYEEKRYLAMLSNIVRARSVDPRGFSRERIFRRARLLLRKALSLKLF